MNLFSLIVGQEKDGNIFDSWKDGRKKKEEKRER